MKCKFANNQLKKYFANPKRVNAGRIDQREESTNAMRAMAVMTTLITNQLNLHSFSFTSVFAIGTSPWRSWSQKKLGPTSSKSHLERTCPHRWQIFAPNLDVRCNRYSGSRKNIPGRHYSPFEVEQFGRWPSSRHVRFSPYLWSKELRNSHGDAVAGTSYLCDFNCDGCDFNCEGLNMTL